VMQANGHRRRTPFQAPPGTNNLSYIIDIDSKAATRRIASLVSLRSSLRKTIQVPKGTGLPTPGGIPILGRIGSRTSARERPKQGM
jgi:hypothetical protein